MGDLRLNPGGVPEAKPETVFVVRENRPWAQPGQTQGRDHRATVGEFIGRVIVRYWSNSRFCTTQGLFL